MGNNGSLLDRYKQNDKLRILMVTPNFGHLSPEEHKSYNNTHHNLLYYFLFMVDGDTSHGVDLHKYALKNLFKIHFPS